MKARMLWMAPIAAVLAFALPLPAQDKPAGDVKPPADAEAEQKAMMEAWQKMAAPGEHHKNYDTMVGKWNIVSKYRWSPEAPWQESKSQCESSWILGGRFLQSKVKGDAMPPMDMEFEGFGLLGYDNAKQKHTSFWADNYGTMMMMAEGDCSADGKEFTFSSTYDDPMTGSKTTMKTLYKIKSADEYVMEFHQPGPDGKDFVMMELTCMRAK